MKEFWSDSIRDLIPYTPGEQPKDGIFIKLNTNENPYPPSPAVLEAIRNAAGERLRLYPDPNGAALGAALADYWNVRPEQVFSGNGSDEVLAFCFKAFFSPGKTVVFPDITYSFYPVYCNLFGLKGREIPLAEDWSVPLEQFCADHSGVVLPNPNAPTGRALSLKEIEQLLQANPHGVVLVDEAYTVFSGASAALLLDRYPNLLIVGTLSKSHALAGMRVGYALGSPDLIAAVNCVKHSFNSYTIDRLALAAAEAALRDRTYYDETTRRIVTTRENTAKRLRELGFSMPESKSNFLFVTHPRVSAAQMQEQLRARGILVRRFDRDRISNYLRISMGTEEQMDILCDILKELTAPGLSPG
jgi:histidinol-phosphate aminotransferase